jgi:cation transporter-like permease
MTFGFSFIVAMVLNFFKSLFWSYFIQLMTYDPIKFVSVCFTTNLIAEIFPILLLIVMHRRNFDPDEN